MYNRWCDACAPPQVPPVSLAPSIPPNYSQYMPPPLQGNINFRPENNPPPPYYNSAAQQQQQQEYINIQPGVNAQIPHQNSQQQQGYFNHHSTSNPLPTQQKGYINPQSEANPAPAQPLPTSQHSGFINWQFVVNMLPPPSTFQPNVPDGQQLFSSIQHAEAKYKLLEKSYEAAYKLAGKINNILTAAKLEIQGLRVEMETLKNANVVPIAHYNAVLEQNYMMEGNNRSLSIENEVFRDRINDYEMKLKEMDNAAKEKAEQENLACQSQIQMKKIKKKATAKKAPVKRLSKKKLASNDLHPSAEKGVLLRAHLECPATVTRPAGEIDEEIVQILEGTVKPLQF